jgi:hypothetical protein
LGGFFKGKGRFAYIPEDILMVKSLFFDTLSSKEGKKFSLLATGLCKPKLSDS